MRTLILGLVFFASTAAFAAPDDHSDSYCVRGVAPVPSTTVWRVDHTVTSFLVGKLPDSTFITPEGTASWVDMILQGLPRQSRARLYPRVVSAPCSQFEAGCVVAPGVDFSCDVLNPDFLAYVNTWNAITLCPDMGGVRGFFSQLMEHEFGHAYGLAHVDATAACGADGPPDCPTSDGCEGETMCGRPTCSGVAPGYSFGDARGFRANYFGNSDFVARRYTVGSHILGLSTRLGAQPQSDFPAASVFPPRIDCARSTSQTNGYQCAIVHVEKVPGSSGLKVVVTGLRDWDYYLGFQTRDVLYEVSYAQARLVATQPDIVLEPSGRVFWLAWTTDLDEDNIAVRRVALSTGAPVVTVGPLVNTGLNRPARLPVRIAQHASNRVLVMFATRRPVVGAPAVNRLGLVRFNFSSSAVTAPVGVTLPTTITSDTSDIRFQLSSDFDFDCRGLGCVLAATVNDTFDLAVSPTAASRLAFSLSSADAVAVGTTGPFSSGWLRDAAEPMQSVQSVSIAPSGEVYLSGGRRHSSDANNIRSISYLANGASTNQAVSFAGDTFTCTAFVNSQGYVTRPATSHGGTSQAFCTSCYSGVGSIESIYLGRTDANQSHCF